MITITDFDKKYDKKLIFSCEKLDIIEKGIVYICGESGAGKTTFINCLCGLDSFSKGKIYIGNNRINNIKNYCSFVYQDFQLIDKWSVKKNLLLSRDGCTEQEIDIILKKLNISSIKESLAYNISAGQKQRVAIARALLQRRNILILDEPFSNLDKDNVLELKKLLKKLANEILIIVVSHLELEQEYYDQKIIIENKEIKSTIINYYCNEMKQGNINKLSIKNILSLCFLFLKKSKHFVFSIISLSLCYFILLVSLTISFQDKSMQAYSFYKFKNANYVSFYQPISVDEYRFSSYKGKYNANNYHTHDFLDIGFYCKGEYFELNSIWYKDNVDNVSSNISSINNNEILISNDYANRNDINIGYTVNLFDYELVVAGFIDEKYGFKNTVFMNTNTYNDINIHINQNKFFFDFIYDNRVYSSSPSDCVKKFDDIITSYSGVSPRNNEIIIPKNMINIFKESEESIVGKTIKMDLLYNKGINNDGDYKEESFVVVGVSDSNIYFNEGTYNRITKYNFNLLKNKCVGLGIINPKKSDFTRAYSNGFSDVSNASKELHASIGYCESWKPLGIAIGSILFVVSFAMIASLILNSVSMNSKELGILVSLDYSKRWRFTIFLAEIVIIVITSIILSIPLGYFGINWLNKECFKGTISSGFNILTFNILSPIITIISSLLLSLIMCIIVNIKLNKKSDIELIYGK